MLSQGSKPKPVPHHVHPPGSHAGGRDGSPLPAAPGLGPAMETPVEGVKGLLGGCWRPPALALLGKGSQWEMWLPH